MYIPKRYGESRIENCPFCGRMSMLKNKQGIPVCKLHKDEELKDLKCVCGELLDVNIGKWGAYFRCMNCGNINFKKAIEMNPQIKTLPKTPQENSQESLQEKDNHGQKKDADWQKSEKRNPREITVNSDEVDFMY